MDSPRIAVIGGGISGLAAAFRLQRLLPAASLAVLEAGPRVGGVLETEEEGGFLLERSADMFTTAEPHALALCRELGLEAELRPTNEAERGASVVRRGRLYPVPEGFSLLVPRRAWPLAVSGLLSVAGKLRMAREYFIPPRREETDESLAAFVRRRFGREAFERLIQPLIGGIYTADPERLSMAATLPQFLALEKKHGSLLRSTFSRTEPNAAERSAGGARYGLFLAPRGGMQQLVAALETQLSDSICTDCRAESLSRTEHGWRLELTAAGRPLTEEFDAVILAVPAHRAAALLGAVDAALAEQLGRIEYASAAVVIGGYRLDQVGRPPRGFGFVVPAIEKRRILACSFASRKFPGRAPEGGVLLRTFVGGALQPELLERDDAELQRIVAEELGELIGLAGEPLVSRVVRWNRAMPQYHVGHLDRVAAIEARVAAVPGLELAGNAYRGVGIPQCIRSGEQAAERLHAKWKSPAAAGGG